MLTSRTAPADPPITIVRMLLTSWKRRRVLRRVKKVFQSRVGVEDSGALPGNVAVEAWRRVTNWHCIRMGFLVIERVLVEVKEIGFVARAVHCRCARDASDEYWQVAPLEHATWNLRPRAPKTPKRVADVAGVNIISSDVVFDTMELHLINVGVESFLSSLFRAVEANTWKLDVD